MSLIDTMIQELQWESVNTRRVLERVPDDKLGWKPHDRSMSMGQLASHIAESLGWAAVTVSSEELDLPANWAPFVATSSAELMAKFDDGLASSLEAMAGCSDELMLGEWRLLFGGQVMLQMPRVHVMRSMVLNHIVHHRAQLCVYLRLNDIPVPAIYGPSADELPKP